VSAQLVSLVNPRLAMYTRAGFLAAIILSINFAIVGCLALYLQRDCTTSTVVDRSSPVTFGDFLTYEEFINTTLDREGVVKEDSTTTTTTVDGCVKRNSAVLVAPYQATLCSNTCRLGGRSAENNGICEDGGPGNASDASVTSVGAKASTQSTSMSTSSSCPFGTDCTDCGVRVPPPSYSGTGITTDVPCWNQYVPCFHPRPPPHPPPSSPPSSPPDCSTMPASCVAQCAQYAPCLTSSSSDPACANAPSQCRQCINYAHCASQGNGRALAEERRLFFGTASPPPVSSCPGGGINACPNPAWNYDGVCDDGGPGSEYNSCSPGTDCTDCGGGVTSSPPPPSPPPPSPSPPPPSPSPPSSPPLPSPSPPPPRSNCTDQVNSGNMYFDGTPMLCTYFTTNPVQCNSNLDAQNNCPVSCRTCQGICMGTCNYASDGDCDDGGPGAEYAACAQGTDCSDCGPRALNPPNTNGAQAPPPPSISPPPPLARPDSYAYGFLAGFLNGNGAFGGAAYSYGDGEAVPNGDGGAVPNATLQPSSSVEVPCGWYRTQDAEEVGGPSYKEKMGPRADRFPWCTEELHDRSRHRYSRFMNLTSQDRSFVNFAILCGLNKMGMDGIPVAPGGVLRPSLSRAPGENLIGTTTSFTTHWSLTVTTKRTVCPKFSAAFSSALAYATYIEIIITMVLVFVFKLFALIEDQKGMIDLSDGVIHASKLKEAGEVVITSSNVVTRLKQVHPE
jgi:hypothetical protein